MTIKYTTAASTTQDLTLHLQERKKKTKNEKINRKIIIFI